MIRHGSPNGKPVRAVIEQLTAERERLHKELARIDGALAALGSSSSKRTISAASRRKMAAAQRARWAKVERRRSQPLNRHLVFRRGRKGDTL
jgi:hypothetical protein